LKETKPQFQNIVFKEFVASNLNENDWVIFPPIKYSPNNVDLLSAIQPPSSSHLFGTDTVGRDVASRMIHGSRVSLSVGFVAVAIYVLIGVLIGAVAGYYGGIMDIIASRLIEIMLTIPTFFIIMTVVAFLPQSIFNIMVVIGITNWPTVARLTRGEFLKTKSLEYVVAAQAMGASDLRTIFRHMLPNTSRRFLSRQRSGLHRQFWSSRHLVFWDLACHLRRQAGDRFSQARASCCRADGG
jgi:ABC-type dipeptide/oligopeptide/nickel transport system permease subunit